MSDLNHQLEIMQVGIDALRPGAVRDEIQSDLDLAAAIIERLPQRISDAMTWEDAYKIGAERARDQMHEAFCALWDIPAKPSTH
jgi:L-alanine-DL-glutamate epimerase-like enolase superfamily enzyme